MVMLPGATDRLFHTFCRTGDARALGKVFDRTAPELLRVALYLSGNRADAEDLVQRTFLAAIEGRGGYDPRRRAVPWLLGILSNLTRRLQRERAQRAAAAATAPEPRSGSQDGAADRELSERIAELRRGLGAPYAEVLELHLELGCNAKEIAARLGRPAGTVRTQLVRALELLRKRLPNGFVAALVPLVPEATALVGMKAAVLAAAGPAGATAATTGAATAAIATGGVLMSKKLVLAVSTAVLLLAVGLYTGWSGAASVPLAAPRSGGVANAVATPDAGIPVGSRRADVEVQAERHPIAVPVADADPGFAVLRVVVRWQDGTPAPGIGVGATGLGGVRNQRRAAVTGDDGTCLLAHLGPGQWRVAITHGAADRTVAVRADEVQTCEFRAAVLATVRGRVVDDRQRPMQNAEIWIAAAGQHARQFVVARSGDDGRFVLGLAQTVQIGARKVGSAPSLARDVDPMRAVDDEIVLALRGAGGRIEGTVRDAQGQPIAWARVLVGQAQSRNLSVNGPYDAQGIEPAGVEVASDRDGRFAVAGVLPGKEIVQAWAPGFAGALEIVEVAVATTRCDFTLAAGAVVHGQVRGADGHGVDGASVRCGWFADAFVDCGTGTDAEGHYRLVDLPAGRQALFAQSSAGNATATLVLTAGDTCQWSPVLERVTAIRGQVLDDDGEPRAGLHVSICDETGFPEGAKERTDAEGHFTLQPADQGAVHIAVGLGEGHSEPLKVVADVRPGTHDLVIRLGAAELPSAHLRGRVLDTNGNPLLATITASRPRSSTPHVATAGADGRFQLGPLPAGRYRLRISTATHGSLPLPELVLPPEASHDLGEVALQPPGRATVDVRDEQGKPTRGFVALYTQDGEWAASCQAQQGRASFDALQPGSYFVCCGGAPFAAQSEVEVAPAAEAHADLQLAAVGYADVAVQDPAEVEQLDLRVFAFVGRRFAGMFGNLQGSTKVRLWLPPGSYAIDIRAHDGRRASAEVEIRGVDDHATIAVELPAR